MPALDLASTSPPAVPSVPVAPPGATPAGLGPSETAAPPPVVPHVQPTYQDKPANKPATAGEEPPLEPPAALAGKIGLGWGQLADIAHRTPPRRITLVCDGVQESLAQQLSQKLQRTVGAEVTVLLASSAKRNDPTLLSHVLDSRPDLFLDLLACPPPQSAGQDTETFTVWVVHEALWPQDRESGRESRAPQLQYRRHQFQSLALGSLLRTELGRQFRDQTVLYELAPAYLLRRVGAPSAAVLVPAEGSGSSVEADQSKRLANAIANAITTYVHGMQRVQF
jgi:hypothetical protein